MSIVESAWPAESVGFADPLELAEAEVRGVTDCVNGLLLRTVVEPVAELVFGAVLGSATAPVSVQYYLRAE